MDTLLSYAIPKINRTFTHACILSANCLGGIVLTAPLVWHGISSVFGHQLASTKNFSNYSMINQLVSWPSVLLASLSFAGLALGFIGAYRMAFRSRWSLIALALNSAGLFSSAYAILH